MFVNTSGGRVHEGVRVAPSRATAGDAVLVSGPIGDHGILFRLEGNEPPHVHVRKGGSKAKFWLSPVELVHFRGLTKPELRRAHELTQEHAQDFLKRWEEHFRR